MNLQIYSLLSCELDDHQIWWGLILRGIVDEDASTVCRALRKLGYLMVTDSVAPSLNIRVADTEEPGL